MTFTPPYRTGVAGQIDGIYETRGIFDVTRFFVIAQEDNAVKIPG